MEGQRPKKENEPATGRLNPPIVGARSQQDPSRIQSSSEKIQQGIGRQTPSNAQAYEAAPIELLSGSKPMGRPWPNNSEPLLQGSQDFSTAVSDARKDGVEMEPEEYY